MAAFARPQHVWPLLFGFARSSDSVAGAGTRREFLVVRKVRRSQAKLWLPENVQIPLPAWGTSSVLLHSRFQTAKLLWLLWVVTILDYDMFGHCVLIQ